MRRGAVRLLLHALTSGRPQAVAAAALGPSPASRYAADQPAAVAGARQPAAFGRGFAADASGAGGSGGGADAWEEVTRLSGVATEMAEEDRTQEAKQLLQREIPRLAERFGSGDPSIGLLHNQLAIWCFEEADYEGAVEAATAARDVWIKQSGEGSQAADFHGIRLGMALAADGRPEEAFPLLEQGLAVAVDSYNEQVKKLEALQPLAEDMDAAAKDFSSEADQAAMSARAAEQQTSVAMLAQLSRAIQEAKFYRALSFLGVRGRELESKWGDKGAGAVFFLEQEMTDAVTDMLRWVGPDHPILRIALREHARLVAQCSKEGLRQLSDDLQIHGQRLADVVEEAKTGQDG